MAPNRKSKSVYNRFTNELSPERAAGSSSKSKQRKKKLSDKLGPQWTKGELERFYDAYRKHEGDWKKVAAAVRKNRSVEMVEALFYMNRAYLSLPEGIASVTGFIAMMTDHYSIIGTESEEEGHDAFGVPRKHQKRKRSKVPPSNFQEVVPPLLPAEGCLSYLKLTPAYAIRKRATEKRTPRFPVDDRDYREDYTPPDKRAKKQRDDDVAHVVASTSVDGSRRGGSSPYRRTELKDSRPIRFSKMSQANESQSKHRDSSMFGNGVRISRDRRHRKGAFARDDALMMETEGVGTVRVEEAEGNDSDYSREACNASEGLKTKLQEGTVDDKHSRDELEAVGALTQLAGSDPLAGLMESESSTQLKEERISNNVDEKYNFPEAVSTSHHREKSRKAGPEDSLLHVISAADNRKLKSVRETVDCNAVSIRELATSKRKRKQKVLGVEASNDSIQKKTI